VTVSEVVVARKRRWSCTYPSDELHLPNNNKTYVCVKKRGEKVMKCGIHTDELCDGGTYAREREQHNLDCRSVDTRAMTAPQIIHVVRIRRLAELRIIKLI